MLDPNDTNPDMYDMNNEVQPRRRTMFENQVVDEASGRKRERLVEETDRSVVHSSG